MKKNKKKKSCYEPDRILEKSVALVIQIIAKFIDNFSNTDVYQTALKSAAHILEESVSK